MAALLLCLLAACKSNKGQLAVTDRNFKEEISRTENLTFTFNNEVMPNSLLYVWDTTEYMRFEPPIKGKFQWTAPNTLVFSPLQPFPPSTDFKAEVTKEVLSAAEDKKLSLDTKSYDF